MQSTTANLQVLSDIAAQYGVSCPTVVRWLAKGKNGIGPGLFNEYLIRLNRTPGVYSFWGQHGEPLYVGMSTNLASRIPSSYKEKELHQSEGILRCKTIVTASASDAAVLEIVFISTLEPRLNDRSKYGDRLTLNIDVPTWDAGVECDA